MNPHEWIAITFGKFLLEFDHVTKSCSRKKQTTAFSENKGNFKERIKKQQLKILKDYVPLLK